MESISKAVALHNAIQTILDKPDRPALTSSQIINHEMVRKLELAPPAIATTLSNLSRKVLTKIPRTPDRHDRSRAMYQWGKTEAVKEFTIAPHSPAPDYVKHLNLKVSQKTGAITLTVGKLSMTIEVTP